MHGSGWVYRWLAGKGILMLGNRLDFCVCMAIVSALLVTGCAHQPAVSAYNPPGFFYGLLHGFISPFALIGSIFTDARIYAFPNSGGWYDFGFMIGVGSFFGGLASR